MFFTTHIKDSNDKLLEKFYNSLLVPNFGIIPNELDDLETFQEALQSKFQYTLHIILIVDEFENEYEGVVFCLEFWLSKLGLPPFFPASARTFLRCSSLIILCD